MTFYQREIGASDFERLQRIQKRLDGLRHSLKNPSIPSQDLSADAIAEMSNTLEALQATAEELSQQSTELLATRQDLETKRQHYQALFELAPDAYLVTDAKGIIQEANCASEALLKLHRDLLVGNPLAVFAPPARRTFFRTQLEQLAEMVNSARCSDVLDNARDGYCMLGNHLIQDWETQLQPQGRATLPRFDRNFRKIRSQ
ncbi:MAG: PAS domain-containing protein [Acaryochloridaceae cyanobacterium RU_4_10]|nr:PAS domain-containing protein [Acaryochloridaceae cyanobacterium RU_4_10]